MPTLTRVCLETHMECWLPPCIHLESASIIIRTRIFIEKLYVNGIYAVCGPYKVKVRHYY